LSVNGNEIVVSKAKIGQLTGTELPKILQDAQAMPNMVNGELKGFVFSRIKKNSLFAKVGLRDGDIVEDINGTPLSDIAQTIRLLQGLKDAEHVTFGVQRNRQQRTFSISVR
jgi:general secretion pathway protein C